MSNSPLIDGKLLTNNCHSPRNKRIDRITPHYMAWYTDARTCCESFVPASRMASANYCIGKDGEIWMNVEERNRAWTSGSAANDNRAITIECANYNDTSNGHVYGELPRKTWDSLVRLCADIATRNGFSRVVYNGSTANYDNDAILLTKHQWFQNTDCPGPWLNQRFDRLAEEATREMDGTPQNNTRGGELVVDGFGGYNTILDLQHYLGTYEDACISGQYRPNYTSFWGFNSDCITWEGTGSPMVKALQKRVGAEQDGIWGRDTSVKLQLFLTNKGYSCGLSQIDGVFGRDSVKALQRYLNDSIN